VVGLLLAAPQTERGDLKLELDKLANRTWSHPITGATVQFARSTIERWYYRAVNAGTDTAAALARRKRCDAVGARLDRKLIEALDEKYRFHSSWVSEDTGQIICALYPVDKAKNANAQRRKIDQEESLEAKHNSDDLPAYLAELIKKFDTTGLAAPFICQPEG
jgi:hypothetical protein